MTDRAGLAGGAAAMDVHKDIELFALSEGLTAHANSIAVRFEEEE